VKAAHLNTSSTFEEKAMNNTMKWIGLIATLVIVAVLPLYTLLEPKNQDRLAEAFQISAVQASTDLYAENCVVCHGARGEGIGDNPALNDSAVLGMSETDLFRVIARGRDNTLMAAWALEEGGLYTNAQVEDLVTFVQQVNWDFVETRVAELGLTPPEVIALEVTDEMLASLAGLPDAENLESGLMVYGENCSACHGSNGAGTVIAPAIDSSELRETPREDLVQIVQNGVPGTLMAGWEDQLDPGQIEAAIELIRRWPEVLSAGVEFPEPELVAFPSSPELIAEGQALYHIACKSCHGVDAYGSPMAPALNNQLFLAETPDAAIYQIIAGGVPGTLMPAWGNRLSDHELQALVAYLRSLEPSAPAILPPIQSQ
jgi:mono/diheme cytochrome c family protein